MRDIGGPLLRPLGNGYARALWKTESLTEPTRGMPGRTEEAAIERLMSELVDAWNRGDAHAYGARYCVDGTFTNVNGALYAGREEFVRRHAEVFAGYLEGTRLGLAIRQLRFVRADVAVVDVDASLVGVKALPAYVAAGPDGAVHTRLLMVLVKKDGSWWISAYHNVWRQAGD
jgi:uncharacterized protein (TIGR02246 family)